MGASYVPEIFMPSEKRILSPAFHDGYFVPPSGFPLLPHQCTKLCAQPMSCSCLAQNSVYVLFCDVQAAFLGRFTALKSSLHNIQFLVLLIYSNKVSIIVKQKEPIMPIQAT